ncbi:MAG: Histidine kinase [Pseudomonadota bacterium]|jgi:signal transduction histidine kinase|nr:Histidine kinase [Pseudomonadota bacterium]
MSLMKKIASYFPHSLKTRLMGITLLFLLLPTSILGYLGYDYLSENIKKTQIRAVANVANTRFDQVIALFKAANTHASHLLNHVSVQCKNNDLSKKDLDTCLKDTLTAFIDDEEALSATLIQTNGEEITVGKPPNINIKPFQEKQIVGFSKSNGSHFHHYYINVCSDSTLDCILIIYPLKAVQSVFMANSGLGISGDVFMLDANGVFITRPHLLTRQISSESPDDHATQHCLTQKNSEILDIDRRNIEIIHSFRFVPEIGGGCIMAHLDQKEAFATLNTMQWRVAMTAMTLIGFALYIALLVGRNIVKPIDKLCEVTHEIINGNYTVSAVVVGDDEISALANAFNLMTKRLESAFDELHHQQTQLEYQVQKRTQELFLSKNQAEEALALLQETQQSLVQAEKMAVLGSLVAGVAHEINTPLGITLTSASFLSDETKKTAMLYKKGDLSGNELEAYFEMAAQSTQLSVINCHRAADLIHSFKQVAVDQTSDNQREFNLKIYLEEVLFSLRPALKKTNIKVQLSCPSNLWLINYPGAISQIITNFVMNSLLHAYDINQCGTIRLNIIELPHDKIELHYSDDGKGIPLSIQSKIFDPFFTTKRSKGGSGLGLHLVYNIVHQKLKGTLTLQSIEGEGTTFILNFARQL